METSENESRSRECVKNWGKSGLKVGRGVAPFSLKGRGLKNNAGENVGNIRYSETSRRTVQEITSPSKRKENAMKPTQFPIELQETQINLSGGMT